MIEQTLDEKEMAFLEELRKYENKWVAIYESEGAEMVVGSGADAVEATRAAEEKGFTDTVLLYVRSFNKGFMPSSRV